MPLILKSKYQQEVVGRRVQVKIRGSRFVTGTIVSLFRPAVKRESNDDDSSSYIANNGSYHLVQLDHSKEKFEFARIEEYERSLQLKWIKDENKNKKKNRPQSTKRKYHRNVIGRRLEIEFQLSSNDSQKKETVFYAATIEGYKAVGNLGSQLHHHYVRFDDGDEGFYSSLDDMEQEGSLRWLDELDRPMKSSTRKRKSTKEKETAKSAANQRAQKSKLKQKKKKTQQNLVVYWGGDDEAEVPAEYLDDLDGILSIQKQSQKQTATPVDPVVEGDEEEDIDEESRYEEAPKSDLLLHRKYQYGDRVLLARDKKPGMMSLGGGNAVMELYPGKNNRSDHPRFQVTDIPGMAYNELWSPNGPQYAGQETCSVALNTKRGVFEPGKVVAVFMRRSIPGKNTVLGWEYCGNYAYRSNEDNLGECYCSAHSLSEATKKAKLESIMKSIHSKQGDWIDRLQGWRDQIVAAQKSDDSPSAPQWLVERQTPTKEELQEKRASLAARSRALGFRESMTNEEFAKLMIEIDEFHEERIMTFVEYDEKIYDFVKDGETTRNAKGQTRHFEEPCAKASDFYAYLDAKQEGEPS